MSAVDFGYVGAPLWSVRFCGLFVACDLRPRASPVYLFKPSIQNFVRRFRFGISLRRKKVVGLLGRRRCLASELFASRFPRKTNDVAYFEKIFFRCFFALVFLPLDRFSILMAAFVGLMFLYPMRAFL